MTSTPPITRVALVDDHTIVRQGIAGLVNGIDGYRVTLEAGNGIEFKERVEHGPVDIAIVDLQMPVMDGYRTIAWIRANRPDTRSVVLTFDASDDALTRAIRLGARGFVLKTIDIAELALVLNTIRDQGYYHNELLRDHEQRDPEGLTSFEREQQRVLERITPRQMEFLRLVADERELTYTAMADLMSVHPRSIDNYFQALRLEFGIRSKTGMLLFAVKWGIVKV